MADENTLKIEIQDTTRDNPLLDEAMGAPGGGAPAGGPGAAPPAFPATVRGKGGRTYDFAEYAKAAERAEGEAKRRRADQAYQDFFGPDTPAFPATVTINGQRYSFEAYTAATARANREAKQRSAEDAYKSLYGGPLTPPDTVKVGGKRMSWEDFQAQRNADPHAGTLDKLLEQFGGGGIGRAFGGAGVGGAIGAIAPALAAVTGATKALHAMRGAVDGVTKGLEGLARNDLSGADEGLNDFRKQLVGTIPIIGDAANAQADLVRAITSLPAKLDAAFIGRARELAPYSATITGAEQSASARSTLADVREADELGPAMGRMIDAETELKLELRELILPIKKFVVEVLAGRLELLVTLVRLVENFPTIWEKLVDTGIQALVFTLNNDADERERALKILRDEIRNLLKPRGDNTGDLFDRFFDQLDAGAIAGRAAA